jgi:hypothetical protein
MTPIKQTIFGEGKGNCFATCVASILDLPLEDVPNFACSPSEEWFGEFFNWLKARGYSVVYLYHPEAGDVTKVDDKVPFSEAFFTPYLYIATGKSPRGDFLHSVVGQYDKVVHDPHPDNRGIIGPARDYLVIVPLEPRLTGTASVVKRPYPRTAPCFVCCRGDGNQILALIGEDLMSGVAGFGDDLPSALRALADELEREVGQEPQQSS